MVTRWDPFRDLLRVQDELNRLFSRTFGPTEGGAGASLGAWAPLVDVYETPERFVVAVELPGVAPEEVDVSVEDSTVRPLHPLARAALDRRHRAHPGELRQGRAHDRGPQGRGGEAQEDPGEGDGVSHGGARRGP